MRKVQASQISVRLRFRFGNVDITGSKTSKDPVSAALGGSLSKDAKESLKKATAKQLFPDSDSEYGKKPTATESGIVQNPTQAKPGTKSESE